MRVTAKIDDKSLHAFNAGINFYVAALGKDATETMNKYSAQLFKDILNRTPPLYYTSTSTGEGDNLSLKQRGEQASKRDIKKIYSLIDYQSFDSPTIQKLIRKKDYEAVNKVIEGAKREFRYLKNKSIIPFNSRDIEVKRLPQLGHIPRGIKDNKATLDKKEIKDFTKKKFDRVGMLRCSIWLAGKIFGVKAPAWVSNKEALVRRFVNIQNDIDTPKHYFRYESRVRTASRLVPFINFSLKFLSEKMRKDLQFKADYNAKRAGYKSVDIKLD